MKNDWHERVYKKGEEDFNTEEWKQFRQECLKRDQYTCQRCEKKNSQGRGLTVHHIMPRIEGGSNDLGNLMTLCNSCHDFVEINGLRTHAEIVGSYEDGAVVGMPEPTKEVNDEGYHFKRPAWHRWVYGSGKNPR